MNDNLKKLIDNAEKISDKKAVVRTQRAYEIKRLSELGIEPFIIEKPKTTTLITARQKDGDSYYTIAESIVSPDLSNKDLQAAFKVNNKVALLKKMLTPEELDDLIMVAGELIQVKNTVKVADIKN